MLPDGSSLRRLVVSLALALGLWCDGWLALAAAAAPPPPVPVDLAAAIRATTPGQLVVGVPPGSNREELRNMLAGDGATLAGWLPNLGLALVFVPVGHELAVAERLYDEPAVDFVAPNRNLARVADEPLDPLWPQQWDMVQVSAPAAWDLAWGEPGRPVAIVDTGILQDHWDLQAQTWHNPGESAVDPATGSATCEAAIAHNGLDDDQNGYIDDCRGWDFVAGDADPRDEHGHGTVVAGIASAATNNPSPVTPDGYEGVAGLGRRTSLMALRVLDGSGRGSAYNIAAALDYATAQGARVVNLSLTFPPSTPDSPEIEILRRAVTAAQAADVLIVGASGNENYNGVDYPAKLPGVLAVGASTRQDTRAYFSNYGDRLDLVAPGEGILSTLRSAGLHTYGYYNSTGSGTSFAAPHVAGAAALIRSLRPDLPQAVVYELIRRTADDVGAPGFDPLTGWGRLNVYRAVSEAAQGLRLELAADRSAVAVGGQTSVHLRVAAPDGSAAGFGARVGLSADLGLVEPITVTVDGRGQAAAVFTAGLRSGVTQVVAALGGISATLPLTVTAGAPAHLVVTASPAVISAGGQAAITATVTDEAGNLVADGTAITFTASLGRVADTALATIGGAAATDFLAGPVAGQSLVTATAEGGIQAAVSVTILPGPPAQLTLSARPARVGPGGRIELSAAVRDRYGNPPADGVIVSFSSSGGVFTAASAPVAGGVALTYLMAPAALGRLDLAASCGAASASAAAEVWRVVYLPLIVNETQGTRSRSGRYGVQ